MSDTLHLGSLITTPQERDAIHVAVAPVTAAEMLSPGQHVSLNASGEAVGGGNTIGIVDPYLRERPATGERFWLFLYPGSITSLRHDWTHPAFEAVLPKDRSESEQWLRGFAIDVEMSYELLIEAAKEYLDTGTGHCLGFDTPDRCWRDGEEFWRHFEIVTNQSVPAGTRSDSCLFFRCAC